MDEINDRRKTIRAPTVVLRDKDWCGVNRKTHKLKLIDLGDADCANSMFKLRSGATLGEWCGI